MDVQVYEGVHMYMWRVYMNVHYMGECTLYGVYMCVYGGILF